MRTLVAALLLLVILTLSCACPTTPAAPTVDPQTLQERLDGLVVDLEQQRQTMHIPGMAIAIVNGDEIVLAQGFGVADLETETPVTSETIFAIGSSTKAFTSTLMGMLVDDGHMDWDDPITDYLPSFDLDIQSEDTTAEVTIRDLLSHRTGFVRMGLLFASGEVPREEVLQDAPAAEPWAPFREEFHYSNVMYMAPGVAAGEVAGTDWDTLVADRIFEPLGMNSTSTSISIAQTDPRLSLGYLWDDDLQEYEHKPMRDVDNIAPSGAINSNVLDMAQWLRLLLGRGEYDGQRLISEEQLEETWTDHIDIGQGVSYGLGWMLREWQGQRVVEHGGNVQGFSAEVALLPDSDLGFVLLTNATVTPLQQQSINMVWEALLGEEVSDSGSDTQRYQDYVGTYVANFGTFEDELFTVLVRNGRLAIDVPGQQVYELKEPNEEGKWYFLISEEIAASFDRDENDDVVGMKLYQAGFVFELPREGYEVSPEIPLVELQKYLGSYHSEELGVSVEVLIQNNRLSVDWPGEMVYELYPPDANGTWVFRVSDHFTLRFNEASDGTVESLTYTQAGTDYLMERTEAVSLPSVEELMDLRETESRKAALDEMRDYQIQASVHSLQSGVKGTTTIYVTDVDTYRVDSDYGKYGYSRTAVNGDQAWVDSSFAPFDELHGTLLEQIQSGHPEALLGDWRDFYESVEVLRSEEMDGTDVYVLQLREGDLPPTTIFVDSATGDVLKSTAIVLQEGGIGILVSAVYDDYRNVHGIRVPFHTESSNEESGAAVVEYEQIEVNLSLSDSFFILTPPEE